METLDPNFGNNDKLDRAAPLVADLPGETPSLGKNLLTP